MQKKRSHPSTFEVYTTSDEAWAAMHKAIFGAKKSIYWEVFIFMDDEVGGAFFDMLEQKAREGLDIKIIVDALGSAFGISQKRIASLKTAGVDLRFFQERKHKFRGIWRQLWTRTHRKILIIDERIGFVGGVNVQKTMKDWLDFHVQIEGDATWPLLRAFAKMYVICGGERKAVKKLLRRKKITPQDIEYIFDEAAKSSSNVRAAYVQAFQQAKKRVILFSPYFFPDKKFLYALWRARKRGVHIDLLIPFRTDLLIVTHAAYALFSLLEKVGVQVYFIDKMMHGKGVIVDDEWAMIGSSNIDQTSFYDNYEANIKISNKKTVNTIRTVVLGWLLEAKQMEGKKWKKRGLWQKTKEWIGLRLYTIWYKKGRDIYLDHIPLRKRKANQKK